MVSTITTEAILGIDFLHKYRANIDLGEKKLSFGDRGCILPFVEAPALVAVTGILPSEHLSLDELRQLQLADATMGLALQSKEAGQKPTPDKVKTLSPASRRLFQLWDQLQVQEQMGHQLDRQKELYDKKVHGKLFEAGDLV